MTQNINVPVHTTLPPSISRPDPYFHLHFHINHIKWTCKSPINYDDIVVRVAWWGENSPGSIFVPRCVNLAGYKQLVRSHAIYPVCVPLNHFSTYLSDMDKLVVDIVDQGRQQTIGRASVDQIDRLAHQTRIQSLSPIMNENHVRLGELAIVMTLESLTHQKSSSKTLSAPIIIDEIIDQSPKIDEINLIDRLIEKSRKIRETISVDVRNDEVNDAILKKTFPEMNVDGKSMVNEDISRIDTVKEMSVNNVNTDSILRLCGDISDNNWTTEQLGPNLNNNSWDFDRNGNDREAIKSLIGVSDSFSSDFVTRRHENGKYDLMTRSEENWMRKLEKDASSDDDPLKHDSIIEELFYKQPEPTKDLDSEIENQKKKYSATEFVSDTKTGNLTYKAKDFEIYQGLSQDNDAHKTRNEDVLHSHKHNVESRDDNQRVCSNDYSVGSDWYRNISAIKVYLDMLWLNSSPQTSSRSARSRSQSSNYSSDREKCRRSHDSGSSFNNSSTSFSVTKPPTPQVFQFNPSHKYFIDYKFPSNVTNSIGREKENINLSVSTTRVSLKLTGSNCNLTEQNKVKSLSVDHVAEFPVLFRDNAVIQRWWKGIVRFKLISQDSAKKETVVGLGAVPLRNVISTNNFYRLIPIRLPRNKNTKTKTRIVIGSLAIRTIMVMSPTMVSYPYEKKSEVSYQSVQNSKSDIPYRMNKSSNLKNIVQPRSEQSSNHSYSKRSLKSNYYQSRQTPASGSSMKITPINLESFLNVSSVRYVNPKSTIHGYQTEMKSYNLYFIGRLLWVPDHKIKSRVLWGTSKASDNLSVNELENFKLSEASLFTLTPDILEKLKNNYAILEVWDVSTDNIKTSLFGLVKIPLNIFHMSFKNEKIRNTILNNVYPLLSSDDWLTIEDPISGTSKGQVHVLLAIGTPQQIENLKLSKENTFNGHWNRNFLTNGLSNCELVEHVIEVSIESLRNFSMDNYLEQSSKETYFYIQYYFPLQNSITDNNGKNWESSIFRSVNNLIHASVDISDSNRHRFRLPLDCSLKSMLSKHFDVLGKKHILFELYLKQYSPFPSSKSVAKGRLQVSSLFQLINQHSVDMDSLVDTVTQQQIPVRLLVEDDSDASNTVGILNLRLSYRTKVIQNVVRQQLSNNNSPYDQPIVRIEILSAIGLQYAAETLVETHPELQYPSVTGTNVNIKFWLTDESNKQSRIYVNSKGIQKFQFHSTKTIPRTFTPKFDHISEVLLGPIIDDENSNSLYKTLAEKIICGIYQLNVEVYHDVFDSIYSDFNQNSSTSKILIGKGRIPLADLLLRSSGFMGPLWLPVFSPIDSDSGLGGCKLNWPPKKKFDTLYNIEKRKTVGAVEVRLGFLDKSDRKNILQLAMDTGYVVPWTNRLETEDLVWQQMDIHGYTFKYITVNIEELELSEKLLNSIFTAEAGFKRSSIKVLIRYRMYKHAVSSSPNFLLNEDEVSGRVYIPINHEEKYCYRISSDLFRYLRESKLEVQIWAIYGSSSMCNTDYSCEQNDDPNDVRLLGSASFELSNLILPCDQQDKSVRHILPIWKRSVTNCGNSNVTITVNISGSLSPMPNYHSDDDDEYDANVPMNSQNPTRHFGNAQRIRTDHHQSFPVHILIEKAVNLKTQFMGNDENEISYKPLNYFVSFPCAEENKIVHSSVVKGNKEVVWNFERDTRLLYTLLTDDQTLDFKIYYSVMDSELTSEVLDEKVLVGVVKLDLSLLLKGFERVIGWYNIIDLQGDCQGQIKVGVSPMIPLVSNTAVVSKSIPPNLHQSKTNKPFTIEDHQSYLSSVRMRLWGQTQTQSDYPVTIPNDSKFTQESDSPEIVSKSLLFDTLKEKLKELDVLNETFKKKMENSDPINKTVVETEQDEGLKSLQCTTSMIPISKMDYGTNTENDTHQFQQQNSNNNNCDADNKLEEEDFENDERGHYESSDEESQHDDTNGYTTCINDLEPFQNQTYDNDDLMIQHKTSMYDHQNHDSNSLNGSDSEEYSTSICEVNPKSNISSRSSSPCSHISETKQYMNNFSSTNHNQERRNEPDEKSNDSWDETIVPTSSHNYNDTHEVPIPDPPQKQLNFKSTIPKFFPPSYDFQEKMKTLKLNLENTSTLTKSNSTLIFRKPEMEDSLSKPNHIVDITDDEASRISRIFGIRKP